MVEKTRLSAAELAENFADLHGPLSRDEALAEAATCLYCFDAPCTRACPTHIDVPRFIRQILHGNTAGAAETILSENIFGGSCARACPTEVLCEGACVDRSLLQSPVQIGRLQRYATDYAAGRHLRFFEPADDSGFRVAIIGSGPAGLACAHELRKLGHAVTVFEAGSVPGGLNTLGIAAYKITTEFALSEVEPIIDMGVEMRYNARVDRRHLARIREEYDAVFVGIGLGETAELGVTGEDMDEVWEALDFVFQSHTGPLEQCSVGRNVVVIGAGNTAIDVATQAIRLGATQVTIVYRRTESDMSAFAYEYDLAKSDGVRFLWQVQPVAFIPENGKLAGVRLERVRQIGSGRGSHVEAIPNSQFDLHCDMAVKALGQVPVLEVLGNVDGIRIADGCVVVDRETGSTGAEGVFAGGDCTSRGAEIVDAVQEGKIAARGIHQFVSSLTP
jgi:glutamate synthase (NADPH/NADH) small chain